MRIQPSLSRAGMAGQVEAGRPKVDAGFSLIELMVVIGIMTILMGMAGMAYSQWRESTALRSATDSLIAHIKQARLTAIGESRKVQITFTNTSYVLDPSGRNISFSLSEYSPNLRLQRSSTNSSAPLTLGFSSSGTANSWGATLVGGSGSKRVVVNQVGRVYER